MSPTRTSRNQFWHALTLTLALAAPYWAAGCKDWRAGVQVGLANSEPEQRLLVDAEAFPLPNAPRVKATPRARYRNQAWAVAVDDDHDDEWAELVPLDVSFAWGPVADPSVLQHLRFHLARRYVTVRWDSAPGLGQREIMRHVSNHHLIPASDQVREDLELIRAGDFVRIEGALVDLSGPPGTMRTSLRRDDTGSGACEVLWVEDVTVARPR